MATFLRIAAAVFAFLIFAVLALGTYIGMVTH